jgi:hypothetical protein
MIIKKNIIIFIILILLLVLILMYNQTDNKYSYSNIIKNTKAKKNIKNNNDISDYILEIDNPDLSFSDDVMTSIDTINLYPNNYPYTFGYKPYYYRLYPYPLRPQYHYHKKYGTYLF